MPTARRGPSNPVALRTPRRDKTPAERPEPHRPNAPDLAEQLLATARCVAAVRAGRSLTDALAETPGHWRPGVQALSFHTLRRLAAAEAITAELVAKPPAPALRALLVVSLALLWRNEPEDALPYPPHTVVDQAVQAAHRSRQPSGFVNATLRRWLREEGAMRPRLLHNEAIALNLPDWWLRRLRADWPRDATAWARAARRAGPMTLRVNRRRVDPASYGDALREAGLPARPVGPEGWRLDTPVPVERLPGFNEGWVSVQDAAAQRAADLLLPALPILAMAAAMDAAPSGPHRRPRVLDACAAPGGKTAHLLERADLDLLALDSDATRARRIDSSLQRLGLSAEVRVADAGAPEAWWDGRAFDAVLLDAPCSGSGVLRRHPDIAWLRRESDLASLSRQQDRLLEALWPLVAPGGSLLYATCSIFRVEGEQRIESFLQRHADARPHPTVPAPGHLLGLAENEAPGSDADDGFFYALLQRHRRPSDHRDARPLPTAEPPDARSPARGAAGAGAPAADRADPAADLGGHPY